MNKYNAYYLIFYNKSKHYHAKNQYNKLRQEVSRLKNMELKLFNNSNNIFNNENNNIDEIYEDKDEDNNNKINNNDNNNLNNKNEAELFLKSIKEFLLTSIKEINNFENNSFKIYYISMQNYFSAKGILISKKYRLLNEYEFFQKFNKEKEYYLGKQIIKDKNEMSKPIINKTENKLFNYFNYETLTSKKIIRTLSTLGLLSLSIYAIFYLRKKYKK